MAELPLQAGDDRVERLAHDNDPVRRYLPSSRQRNLVASRNKLLNCLEHLIFDPRESNRVGERDRLHRLLERELWIFGEVYHLMTNDRCLTEMLRTHLKFEGFPTTRVESVKRWGGKGTQDDLHLAAKMQEFEITRHLVVELKAADIILGRDELNQVEDYANVVLSNPAFATDKARWDFILVGTDYNAVVANRFANDGRALGQVLAPEPVSGGPQIRVHVRRWRDIINENRRRSNFMTSNLEHDPTFERARSQDIL